MFKFKYTTNDIWYYPYTRILLSHTILQFLQMNSFNEIVKSFYQTIVQPEQKIHLFTY